MSISLKDRNVLITGAGRGIGKRLAMGFAQAGARVGLLARSQAELDLAKLEIDQACGTALRIRADVRDMEQMHAAVERMRAVFGGVDALIAAAGVQGPIGPFATTSPKAWNEAIDINLIGTVNACRVVLPHMIENALGQDYHADRRRRSLFPAELHRLRRVQGRLGPFGRASGRRSPRSQCSGQLHRPGRSYFT